ncbi:MAG: hypothetical protein OXG04_18375 [Acidobacteria bacterium]|nr:hypothetical protein [Acidobacteriota bacterium]
MTLRIELDREDDHEAQMDQWKDNESTVIPAVLREGRTLYAA